MEGSDPGGSRYGAASQIAMRVFELRIGTEFAAFFAGSATDLPDDEVNFELRAASSRHDVTTRGATGTIMGDILLAIVSGGVSAQMAVLLPATITWLRRRASGPRLDDVTAALARVRATSERILGSTPTELRDAAFEKDSDGKWRVAFNYRDLQISAVVEPTGAVVTWRQTPLLSAATRSVQFDKFGSNPTNASPRPSSLASQKGHVFISAAEEDAEFADQLQQDLEKVGIRVWRDVSDLFPGDDQPAAIRRAITDGAVVFLACLSSRSIALVKSQLNVQLLLAVEQLRSRQPGQPWLIPVRFDDCVVPDIDLGGGRTLATLTRADLFGVDRDNQATRLQTAIARILGYQ